MKRRVLAALLASGFLAAAGAHVSMLSAQQAMAPATGAAAEWAIRSQAQYQVIPNVTYLSVSGYESKLDVYRRRDAQGPQKTLIFYHGGGWIGGTKESYFMRVMPWLEMGWNVVNVEYRMTAVALAPAAVEDAQCALKFVVNRAKDYNIDTSKIVVAGESAGGHLSLTTGMIPASAGFTGICASGGGTSPISVFTGNDVSVPKVAAILDWFGITDVNDMLATGANPRAYAVQWLGSMPNREAVAKSVSPLTYVRADLPPILVVHGDADPIVPYAQSTRLLDALKKAGASAELFTVPGGGHGNFKADELSKIYAKTREFLSAHGI